MTTKEHVTREYVRTLVWAAREQLSLARLAASVKDEDERLQFYRSNVSKGEGMREGIAVAFRMSEDTVRRDINIVEETLLELERERKAEEDAA